MENFANSKPEEQKHVDQLRHEQTFERIERLVRPGKDPAFSQLSLDNKYDWEIVRINIMGMLRSRYD